MEEPSDRRQAITVLEEAYEIRVAAVISDSPP
jgi:hypothetical protein